MPFQEMFENTARKLNLGAFEAKKEHDFDYTEQ